MVWIKLFYVKMEKLINQISKQLKKEGPIMSGDHKISGINFQMDYWNPLWILKQYKKNKNFGDPGYGSWNALSGSYQLPGIKWESSTEWACNDGKRFPKTLFCKTCLAKLAIAVIKDYSKHFFRSRKRQNYSILNYISEIQPSK